MSPVISSPAENWIPSRFWLAGVPLRSANRPSCNACATMSVQTCLAYSLGVVVPLRIKTSTIKNGNGDAAAFSAFESFTWQFAPTVIFDLIGDVPIAVELRRVDV